MVLWPNFIFYYFMNMYFSPLKLLPFFSWWCKHPFPPTPKKIIVRHCLSFASIFLNLTSFCLIHLRTSSPFFLFSFLYSFQITCEGISIALILFKLSSVFVQVIFTEHLNMCSTLCCTLEITELNNLYPWWGHSLKGNLVSII